MKPTLVHIEICKSSWKKGTYCVRIGTLADGSTEISNCGKEEVMEQIKEAVDAIEEEEPDLQ